MGNRRCHNYMCHHVPFAYKIKFVQNQPIWFTKRVRQKTFAHFGATIAWKLKVSFMTLPLKRKQKKRSFCSSYQLNGLRKYGWGWFISMSMCWWEEISRSTNESNKHFEMNMKSVKWIEMLNKTRKKSAFGNNKYIHVVYMYVHRCIEPHRATHTHPYKHTHTHSTTVCISGTKVWEP